MDKTSLKAEGTSSSLNGVVSPDKARLTGALLSSGSNAAEQPRAKRRKARRACQACQRAHLTCGDERPCARCVKRGLQAECQDGMRKKAKYLHDAPIEALMPGAEQTYKLTNDKSDPPTEQYNKVTAENGPTTPQQPPAFQQDATVHFSNFSQPIENSPSIPSPQFQPPIGYSPYGNQTSPLQTQIPTQPQIPTPIQNPVDNQGFGAPIFDVNDPMFNFDLAGMNFGNHYGALEFGMLGQISSGAHGNNMQRNNSGTYQSPSVHSSTYVGDSPDASNFLFSHQQPVQDFQSRPLNQHHRSNNWVLLPNSQDQFIPENRFIDEIHTYATNAVPVNVPGSGNQSNGSDMFQYYAPQMSDSNAQNPPQLQDSSLQGLSQSLVRTRRSPEIPTDGQDGQNLVSLQRFDPYLPQTPNQQRLRDRSSVYSSVTRPYPYTEGFQALINIMLNRFRSDKLVRIARALAAVRPSFISCTRNLTNEDLVFMEKSFQRQLLEYEELIKSIGTPTIVCRRTGEVAHAANEFSLMTGWDQSVLLGHAPNLNVNKAAAGTNSGSISASSRGGMNTPRVPLENIRADPARPQPVYLTELLDDDSVVQFFDDFSQLAFADSKGSACRPCKLVKYKTKEDYINGTEARKRAPPAVPRAKKRKRNPTLELGPQDQEDRERSYLKHLGDSDGKIDCMFCWTVKRDVFDIPLMIVINFLPINTE